MTFKQTPQIKSNPATAPPPEADANPSIQPNNPPQQTPVEKETLESNDPAKAETTDSNGNAPSSTIKSPAKPAVDTPPAAVSPAPEEVLSE